MTAARRPAAARGFTLVERLVVQCASDGGNVAAIQLTSARSRTDR